MTAWITIEHAPKDGTLVDLWVKEGAKCYRLIDCRWSEFHSAWVSVDDENWEVILSLYGITPTHYSLPLPGPNT